MYNINMYNRRVYVPGMHVEARGGLYGAGFRFHLHVVLEVMLVWLARLAWQAFSPGTLSPPKCLSPTLLSRIKDGGNEMMVTLSTCGHTSNAPGRWHWW